MEKPREHRHKRKQAIDEVEIARLFCRAYSQEAMAQKLGISRDKVRYSLAKLYERWKADSLRDFDAAKAKELQKIDYAESQFWEAWELSKNGFKSSTERSLFHRRGKKKKLHERLEGSVTKEESCGDPRFIFGVLDCIKQRRELLGLDTPPTDTPALPPGMVGAAVIFLPAYGEPLKPPINVESRKIA